MPKKPSASSRARKIKLLLFDVDGVLTDGKLFIFPAPHGMQPSLRDPKEKEQSAKHGGQGGFGIHSQASFGQSMIEAKGFHVQDGTSICSPASPASRPG